MSNPTVFDLNKVIIDDNILFIEDNIGESIHFHFGLVRFDLTVKEFEDITEKLLNVLDQQVNIENFCLKGQNEYFLERISEVIPYISKVEETLINIEELKYLYESEDNIIKSDFVRNTPGFKYYSGNKSIIHEYEFKLEIWQTKEEAFEWVRDNRNKTIFIDENNYILDGYKSICAALALDECLNTVSVKKIYLEDGKSINYVLKREKNKW